MRLIDADANIETMKKCAENPENEQALLCYRYTQRILEEAPTVEPASPWHRCEEQLPPNDGKEVLVTDGFHVGIGICMYKWSKTKKWTQEAVWYKWNLNDYGYPMKKFKTDTHIKAWMPLPEPPKEEE